MRESVSAPMISAALDVAGADHRVGDDHALQPARAAEDEIERGGARIADLELRLHARRERRHEIGCAAAARTSPKLCATMMTSSDSLIDARGSQRLLRGLEGDVRW